MVRESGGIAIPVNDEQIEHAALQTAKLDGLLLCPEGGATLAAYHDALASGLVSQGDRAILFNCSAGLKYPMPEAQQWLDRNSAIDFTAL